MKGTDIIVREAAIRDLETLHEVEMETFQSGWTLENLRKEIMASFSIVLVAEYDDSIIGYISAWLIHGEIQINRLAVIEKHRRKGVAGSLLDDLLLNCAGSSPFKILLEVREKNAAGRAFYRSRGFVESGLRREYYRDDNAVLLEKEIAS
jgi:ribosomal-protein-alanine N-acetyltransferase